MCPCLSSRSEYATCSKSELGLMSPSLNERQNYCFGLYELCPLFSVAPKEDLSDRIVELDLVEA